MAIIDKKKALEAAGFTVGERDLRLNRKYPGRFMVVEEHDDSELPTDDGSNGPWCIVGDDINALILEAHEYYEDLCVGNVARGAA